MPLPATLRTSAGGCVSSTRRVHGLRARKAWPDCQGTDPDFSWQGQWPIPGSWQSCTDPQSGQRFTVWEGHYVYPGSGLTFIPTVAGGMFEGLMPDEVVPETSAVGHRGLVLPGPGRPMQLSSHQVLLRPGKTWKTS